MLAALVRSWLSEVLLLLLLEEERQDAFVAAKLFPHQTCFGSCPDCFHFHFMKMWHQKNSIRLQLNAS